MGKPYQSDQFIPLCGRNRQLLQVNVLACIFRWVVCRNRVVLQRIMRSFRHQLAPQLQEETHRLPAGSEEPAKQSPLPAPASQHLHAAQDGAQLLQVDGCP